MHPVFLQMSEYGIDDWEYAGNTLEEWEYTWNMLEQWEYNGNLFGCIYIYIEILWDCNENILEYISLHLNNYNGSIISYI